MLQILLQLVDHAMPKHPLQVADHVVLQIHVSYVVFMEIGRPSMRGRIIGLEIDSRG
jgi:hypothetical protein